MACDQGMATERLFLNTLKSVTRWTITGTELRLYDAAGNVVAQFDGRHM